MTSRADRIETACEVMHDAYEVAAVDAGWETQARSRKPWAEVPEANKATMRAAVAALLEWLEGSTIGPGACPVTWREGGFLGGGHTHGCNRSVPHSEVHRCECGSERRRGKA